MSPVEAFKQRTRAFYWIIVFKLLPFPSCLTHKHTASENRTCEKELWPWGHCLLGLRVSPKHHVHIKMTTLAQIFSFFFSENDISKRSLFIWWDLKCFIKPKASKWREKRSQSLSSELYKFSKNLITYNFWMSVMSYFRINKSNLILY